jgi:hypothetical protein
MNVLSQEIVTMDQILETYQRVGRGKLSLEPVILRNVFPITLEKETTRLLNLLGLYVQFSGANSKTPKTFSSSIAKSDLSPDLIGKFEDDLGLKLGLMSDNAYHFLSNGQIYARIIWQMGYQTSISDSSNIQSKKTTGFSLPEYLTKMIVGFDDLDQFSQRVARKYIYDFVNVYFDCKRVHGSSRELRTGLIEQQTKQQVESQGELIISAINSVYPKVDVTPDAMRVHPMRGGYCGYILFSFDNLIQFTESKFAPVELAVKEKINFTI